MKDGFFPALGTPLDREGSLERASFGMQIEKMIDAGASGLLCMGSMGNMVSIRDQDYPDIAEACVNAAAGRVPVMVGVMDNSVSRVMDRIYALGDIEIEGVVATTPYYYKSSPEQIISFFEKLASESYYPVYVYDLPSVTQSPLDAISLGALAGNENIAGIKSANYDLLKSFMDENRFRKGFEVLFSGLDVFDKAIQNGLAKNLDGMFTCMPKNTKSMYLCARNGDYPGVSVHLANIVRLRDEFVRGSVFSAYSHAMELLGMPGEYQPDYHAPAGESVRRKVYECMKETGEI
ncbi:MAG: dihydrodipicolinate synthase family protein [Clostridia bacterium]|nr:dihydrodipicolinate synthase family protein [Clostridia bacterium]